MAIDEEWLNEFMGNFLRGMEAVAHATTVIIGDQMGLYKALAERPMTAAELATATSCDLRYVLQWLSAPAASGHAQYDATTQLFIVSEEQALAFGRLMKSTAVACLRAAASSIFVTAGGRRAMVALKVDRSLGQKAVAGSIGSLWKALHSAPVPPDRPSMGYPNSSRSHVQFDFRDRLR